MNLAEFKAWFDGYTEAMEGRPTEKQWKRIQGRVKEIKDAPTSYQQFISYIPHYYIPTYTPAYQPYWIRYQSGGIGGGAGNMQMAQGLAMQSSGAKTITGSSGMMASTDTVKLEWNSADAFRDLGRADALNGSN